MVDWVKLIISPALLAIPPLDCDKFYIFVVVSCDLLWYYRNKAFHDALSFDALQVSQHINKVSLIWNILQPRIKPQLMWNAGYRPHIFYGYKFNFDTAIYTRYLLSSSCGLPQSSRLYYSYDLPNKPSLSFQLWWGLSSTLN
jgi:hypothetical protein